MSKMYTVLVFVSVLCLVASGDIKAKQKIKIKSFIDSLMSCRRVTGLTLAVVSGNDTWTEGFGLADIDRGVKVNKNTLFGIGSVTKSFTMIILSMLMEESNGRIKWTTPVRDILGDDFAFADETRTRELSLKDLATHRTGLHGAIWAIFAGFNHSITEQEIFKRRFRFLPEVEPFRDEFDYNNGGYALLGYIVEVLSKEPYNEVLRKRIFKPLGMSESRVMGRIVTPDDDNVAKPYLTVKNKVVKLESDIHDIYPAESAGSILSSAKDMSKWLHFLLREGRTADNQTLISPKFLKETFKTHIALPQAVIKRSSLVKPVHPVSDIRYGYGYAWMLSNYNGYRKIWHSGGLYAYRTYFTFYPDLDIGIFTSVNGAHRKTGRSQILMSYYITDVLTGQEPWLNVSTACTFPLPWKKARVSSRNNSDVTNTEVKCVACYTGKYGHYFYGDLEVKVGKTNGAIELVYRKFRGSLHSTNNETKFKLEFEGPFEFFSRPDNETVLFAVTFANWNEDTEKYNEIQVAFERKMVFSRNISFYDLDEDSHNHCTRFEANSCVLVLLFIVNFILS